MNQQPNPTCLNCDEPLSGSFCHQCGQKNLPLKQSLGQLLLEFFGDFFNYDGRFLRSIRLMLSKPGAITLAYMEGKRTSYVNPVRFYLFTSAFYFLVINYLVLPPQDPSTTYPLPSLIKEETVTEEEAMKMGIQEKESENIQVFLAKQASLSPEDRVPPLVILFAEKFIEVKEKYGEDKIEDLISNEVFRRLPQLLLISMPLLALISKLVFFRRKHYWYIDHLVFIFHGAISLFFLLLIQHGIGYVARLTEQGWLEQLAQWLTVVWVWFYLISFKRFFGKGWGKTILLLSWIGLWQVYLLVGVLIFLLVISVFNL
jgi:hypothetical protein